MSDASGSARDPLDLLIEEFLSLYRGGEPVTPESFAAHHPEHEEALRELLPTLLALEDVKQERVSSGSGPARVALPELDRLGDFRIERELGRGGMGVVFEAVQETLNRRVALKVMPQASLLTGHQLDRFRQEAQIAARLHHTNIVPVYGSGASDGYHYYAMQFITGQSLDKWRDAQQRQLPVGDGAWAARARFVARVGVAVASALHCAHGHGTLHRDIKPANFLLDQEGDVWVTDFGLAKALETDGLTRSGDIVGTLQYMPPEHLGGVYDVRSEVFALGVTLYELLALCSPFGARTRGDLMERVRDQRFVPLERACPDAPRDLVVIIAKAMARDPRDRYESAQALQRDLQAFLEDRPIVARRLSMVSRARRWCRRNRMLAGAIAVAMLASLVAAVTGWTSYVATQGALELAEREGERAENNLKLSLAAFGDVFDRLVGREPVLDFEEDPDTGQELVVVQSSVSQRDVVLLREMLAFYDRFATENANSESLRYETARANRRVGAIHAQLGEPKSLEVAGEALQKALNGFLAIEGRDVRQDVAQVHTDLGFLAERLRRTVSASVHFQEALELLSSVPNAASPGLQLRRAQLLFALYRTKDRVRRRREGPWGSVEFFAAMAIVGDLLDVDGDNPDVRALYARCLREDARGPDGRAVQDQVVAIFRALATEHPDRNEYRSEFCQALLIRARRSRDASVADLTLADELITELVSEQPLFRDYQFLQVQIRARLAVVLHSTTTSLDGADLAARQQLARGHLTDVIAMSEQALRAEQPDLRFVNSLVAARGALGLVLIADGDRSGAKRQAELALELLERPGGPRPDLALRPEDGWRRSGPSRARSDRRRVRHSDDVQMVLEFGLLLLRLDDPVLRERVRKLTARR